MKKSNLLLSVLFLGGMMLTSCGGNETTLEKEVAMEESKKEEPQKAEEKKSVSQEQAVSELKKYISDNKKKFSKHGSVVSINPYKGDYNADGLDDFFFTVFFHEEGTEFDFALYFFRDSQSELTQNLTQTNKINEFSSIEPTKIKNNEIEAICSVTHPIVGDTKEFKTKFTIKDSKMILNPSVKDKANKLYFEMEDLWQNSRNWEEEENEESGY